METYGVVGMLYERMTAWLLKLLSRAWLTVVLVSSLVSVLLYSLDKANWVKEDRPLINAFLVGLLIGWLLARSRYGGLFAFFYSLFMSLVIALNTAGKILPAPGGLAVSPFSIWINSANLRAFEFYLRAQGWVETLQAGQNIDDPGLFVLLLAWLLAACGVWMMWMLARKQRALEAVLPVGFLFTINVHLSRQPVNTYWVFLFLAALLIVQKAYIRRRHDWQRRGVDYPEQLGLEWGASALALVLLIALVARVAPIFGTPQGWQSIAEWVEKSRQRTSDTAERLFSGVNPPPPPAGEEPAAFVNTPNLAEIGSPLPQGTATILWVSTSDPPPAPPEIAARAPGLPGQIHYWRSSIFGEYTGRGWSRIRMADDLSAQTEPEETPPAGRYYLRQSFEIVARHSGALFSVNEPLETTEGANLRGTLADNSLLVEGDVNEYQVISAATRVTANQLAEAPWEYPLAIQQAYLQLPEELPRRVRSLAQRVAGMESNPYQKALRIQEYLRLNYPYDLSAPLAPQNRDVVDYFLFEGQSGFCSHYASAMTVMLRSLGVPARVVSGYAAGAFDAQRGAYHVTETAAHAWVEVYFPGYGWVEFEPTPYRAAIVYSEDIPLNPGSQALIQFEDNAKSQGGNLPLFIVIGIAVLLLALPMIVLRLFSLSRSAPAVQVDALYRRIRRALGWAGLRAGAHVTPDEYLARYSLRLGKYKRLSLALRRITELYCEVIYSPHPPDEQRVRAAGRAWQGALREWLALLIRERVITSRSAGR